MLGEEVSKANAEGPAWDLGEENGKQDLDPCNKMPPQLWLLAKAHDKDHC